MSGAVLELYVPGEISLQPKGFAKNPPVLYASRHNPGASTAAALLRAGMPAIRIEEETPPPIERALKAAADGAVELGQVDVQSTANVGSAVSRVEATNGSHGLGRAPVTHFLLYLAHETWVGAAGEALAKEVRAARAVGMRIVMLHENDMEHGGCEFGRFFTTTPGDLIQGGLYSALAFALYPGPYLPVSIALVAGALGATPLRVCKAGVPIKPAAARAKEAEIRGKNPSKGGGPIRGKNPAMRVLPRAASGSKQRSTRVARVMVEVSIQSPQSGAASQSNMMEVVASSSQGNQGEESSTAV